MQTIRDRVLTRIQELKRDREQFLLPEYTTDEIVREFGSLLIQTITQSPDPQLTAWLLMVRHSRVNPEWKKFLSALSPESQDVAIVASSDLL